MVEWVVAGITIVMGGWLPAAKAHRRVEAVRALERYARDRGLVFVPGKSREASPRVTGTEDGVAFVVDLYQLAGQVRMRLTASPKGRAPVLSVGQRRAFAWLRGATLVVGDDAFDRAFIVTEGDEHDADTLREAAPLLLAIDARRTGLWLRSDGSTVTLSWAGMDSDPGVIDAARAAVVVVASSHRPDAPYR